MAQLLINIGTTPNDQSGDPLRTAFDKTNQNFTELYNTVLADVAIPAQTGQSGKLLSTNGTTLSWVAAPVLATVATSGSYSDLSGLPDASGISTVTTAFNSGLSAADNTVQKALDTIDNALGDIDAALTAILG